MLSYLHAYHAGNHADILKHFVLTSVINYLNKKDKPYTFFDTHSASGVYTVDDIRAQKTGEMAQGYLKLSRDYITQNADFNSYLNTVQLFLPENKYPGSPFIELSLLRKTDFAVFSELHPKEFENLKSNVRDYLNCHEDGPKTSVHHRNGFEMLKSMTPPATKRGAVLIDPSYEEDQDYIDVSDTVDAVLHKWSGAVIMVWYPLLSHRSQEIDLLVERLEASAQRFAMGKCADFRLKVQDENAHVEKSLEENDSSKPRLYGSGMFVINPPFTLEENIGPELEKIEKLLYRKD